MHSNLTDQIHSQALEASFNYKRAEARLLEILIQVERHRVYLKRGHPSLFQYVTSELGLSENVAYSLITVARKAKEFPELKTRLAAGTLTLSKARRIVPVLKPHNKNEWLKKAEELTYRQLEKEIARIHPREAIPERASYITPERIKLEVGLTEQAMLRLRRIQDLLSQSRRRAVSLEETIEAMSSEYLKKHDPVEKAKRHRVRNSPEVAEIPGTAEAIAASQDASPASENASMNKPESTALVALPVPGKREPIPLKILYEINLRDLRRCTFTLPNGHRCIQSRWVEIHHKRPVKDGGKNTLDNLLTLCSAHHKLWHLRQG